VSTPVDLAMMLVRALWPIEIVLPVDLVGSTADYLNWLDKLPVREGGE
jgi:hypothetical protein